MWKDTAAHVSASVNRDGETVNSNVARMMSSDDWDALEDLAFLSECHQRNAELCGIAGILLAANLESRVSEVTDEDDRPRTRLDWEVYREQKIRERSFRRFRNASNASNFPAFTTGEHPGHIPHTNIRNSSIQVGQAVQNGFITNLCCPPPESF